MKGQKNQAMSITPVGMRSGSRAFDTFVFNVGISETAGRPLRSNAPRQYKNDFVHTFGLYPNLGQIQAASILFVLVGWEFFALLLKTQLLEVFLGIWNICLLIVMTELTQITIFI